MKNFKTALFGCIIAACMSVSAAVTNNIPTNKVTFSWSVPVSSVTTYTNIIQFTTDNVNWKSLITRVVGEANDYVYLDYSPSFPYRYYRVIEIPPTVIPPPPVPSGMTLITDGSFLMGQRGATAGNGPEHIVNISAFLMETNEVSYTLWTNVYQWAVLHGYTFEHVGSGKAANHPVQKVSWYDVVKWCNARSEKEGMTPCYFTDVNKTSVYRNGRVNLENNYVVWSANGYRLPTEAEWEKASRGGVNGFRFSWAGDTISQNQANYFGNTLNYNYDMGPTGYNPRYKVGVIPYTGPVGTFKPNAYKLYNMNGNVAEWVWDWYSRNYYQSSPSNNPQGPNKTSYRTTRGGSYKTLAAGVTCYSRDYKSATTANDSIGFRCVRVTQ